MKIWKCLRLPFGTGTFSIKSIYHKNSKITVKNTNACESAYERMCENAVYRRLL